MTQEDMEAKREMAIRLVGRDGVDQYEAKVVSYLEDYAVHGDPGFMVIFAKYCALGRGMERDAERAEALVSESAKKGNHEACLLLRLINHCKGKQYVDLESL